MTKFALKVSRDQLNFQVMEGDQKQTRKEFIRKALIGSASLAMLGSLSACEPAEPEMLMGKVKDLAAKGTITKEFNGDLVMAFTRPDEKIIIFSLVCRHKRCTVEWKDEVNEFHCPCHEGKYNAIGKVISGPPPGPLRKFKSEIRGEDFWVLNEYA